VTNHRVVGLSMKVLDGLTKMSLLFNSRTYPTLDLSNKFGPIVKFGMENVKYHGHI
jgi:hypothetical protein